VAAQMTNTHLVCYSDKHFRQARARLVDSAAPHGVDKIHEYSPEDLR
jgi:hypothetical protein